MMSTPTRTAFFDELEKIGYFTKIAEEEKDALLSPRQALAIRGGGRNVLRSLGKRLGLVKSTVPKSTAAAAPTATKEIGEAALRAETEAAIAANPRLQAALKKFPEATKATNTRPGYAMTPTPKPAASQMPRPASAESTVALPQSGTMVPSGTAVPGAAARPMPSQQALRTARGQRVVPEVKHGPYLPPKAVSPKQVQRMPFEAEPVRRAMSARRGGAYAGGPRGSLGATVAVP